MMSQPTRLAAFIAQLPQRLRPDEQLELVLAGDIIDFLAMPPYQSWTPDPRAAQAKCTQAMQGPGAPVFQTLAGHVAAGHRLTLLLGNHDVELALPSVQTAVLQGLSASPYEVRFIDDGRAYRCGGVLIEHGNRYDGANVNDWDGLRALRSAYSRNEEAVRLLHVSAGSEIVEKVVNPLKPYYPFIDLLQPQNELMVLLLLAFEPQLALDVPKLAALLHGGRRQLDNLSGRQPGRTREVASSLASASDPELAALFGEVYQQLHQPGGEVGAREWLQIFQQVRQGSLTDLLQRGEPVPVKRLQQMRVLMRRLVSEEVFRRDGPTGVYGQAAQRMLGHDVEVVVMGHTHLARHIGPAERATYINTGTWADCIRVPEQVLAEGPEALAALPDFLRRLLQDENVRSRCPTYADIRVAPDGQVQQARLEVAA